MSSDGEVKCLCNAYDKGKCPVHGGSDIQSCTNCGHEKFIHNCYDEMNNEYTNKYKCGKCSCENWKSRVPTMNDLKILFGHIDNLKRRVAKLEGSDKKDEVEE